MNLRIPGPTPLPPEAIAALAQQMINHRGPEFEALFGEISAWLKLFFETEQEVLVLTCSGTGGMEAAIANTLSPGDRVLAVPVGTFGDRFVEIAEAYGADVTRMAFPLGQAADPAAVAAKVAADGPYRAVLLTQNETSTGVTNDIQALSAAIRAVADPAPLLLVDGISALGAVRMPMDAWKLDVVVSSSQKAWMAPPGLAFVAMSERAWAANKTAKMPRYYLDLAQARKYARRNQTPATPNLPALYGLHVSLKRMVAEGLDAIEARHERIGAYCRQRALALGLTLYADPRHASNTVSALGLKPGMNAEVVLEKLRVGYDIICAASKDPRVEVIRIGHMGYVSVADIDAVFAALATILTDASR
ncbi:MAG: alanine--glyoxylate aminotransferase family protein [Chloroflexota bacterium]